jgi:thioredoxin 1
MNDAQAESPKSTEPVSKPQRGKFNFWRWFWLSFLVVSLSWAFYDFYVPANHVTWAKDFASAQQQAAQSGEPIILFFTAQWCVPCRIMKRKVWADEQVETLVKAGFTAVMIDVDDPNATATLSRYRIGATPTTIITDPQGNVLKRVEGGMDKTEFLALLGELNPEGS